MTERLEEKKRELPPGATRLNLLGVEYAHVKTADGGDLYLTNYGVPFYEQIRPANWYAKDWFEANRERLCGTSTVYRVRTRPVNGRSKDVVVKWCRVGEEVPFDTFTFTKFAEAEFNSPYEEFSLVMEMRKNPEHTTILTHRPLAIYVPAKKLKLWQTGRSQSKIELKKAKFRDVELDIYRQYILIYEWVKGVSCPEAYHEITKDDDERRKHIITLTDQSVEDMRRKGFRVLDMKPEHLIVRPDAKGDLLRARDGKVAYALVDFELLERTPEHEREVTASRRATYLKHQKDRFVPPPGVTFPENLKPTTLLGVDYVYGHSESTQGELWVVGLDPELFDYFLPERWRRTRKNKLSQTNETYYTKTKDNINLVWKVSRCGERPDADPETKSGLHILEHGYNSPFEEFAIALELNRRGFPATYPRAIYMTGQETELADYHVDVRRYNTHQNLKTPDGEKALRKEHNYIMVWGFWNGLDEVLARKDDTYCQAVNLPQALTDNHINDAQLTELMENARIKLRELGFEDLNLKPTHFLLSLDPSGKLLTTDDGQLALHMCNFSLLRRL